MIKRVEKQHMRNISKVYLKIDNIYNHYLRRKIRIFF
jgi:hypothetical protein